MTVVISGIRAFCGHRSESGRKPAAGERTCLGAALASLMLKAAVTAFGGSDLALQPQDMRPCGVITLTPSGPISLRRTVRHRLAS